MAAKWVPKRRRFVSEYLIDQNGAAAYVRAGYTAKNANVAAASSAQLLRIPMIRDAVAFGLAKAAERADLTVERVLDEMTRLAFYDMTTILSSVGDEITMRDPRSLPEDLRRAIVAIKPVMVGEKQQFEVKFADKQKALDSLARHLQMFKDTVIVENVFRIVKEMDDDELARRLTELERSIGDATALHSEAGTGKKTVH